MSMNRPRIVGLTGGIASGKTTATDYLMAQAAEMNWAAALVDADVISRALTAPGGELLPAIREKFGDGVFQEDGTLNRRALGALAFENEPTRRALEAIIHPVVQRRSLEMIAESAASGAKLVFLSVPLLYESGMDALCDETWVLLADEATRIARLIHRDQITEAQARERIDSQMSDEDKRSRADVVIRTNRPVEATRRELKALLREVWGRSAE